MGVDGEQSHRPVWIVVGGQVPPPVCGQHVCVAQLLEWLDADPRARVTHVDYRFADSMESQGRVTPRKLLELLRAVGRILGVRRSGRPDLFVHPVSGPSLAGAVKDAALVLVASLVCRTVVLQFHGGGHATDWAPLRGVRRVLAFALGRAEVAVVHAEIHRADPELLGIPDVAVVPHRVVDRRDEALRPRDDERSGWTVLYVGHLGPHRGTPELAAAVARLRDEGRDVRLHLVGRPAQGWSSAALADTVAPLGDAVRHDDVLTGRDLDAAYAGADVFAFPSRHEAESFGLVLVEALMWGLPVVASDWRAAPEVLGGDDVDVVLHPSGATVGSALEDALADVLDGLDAGTIRVPSAANRRLFEQRYDARHRPLVDALMESAGGGR